MPRIALKIDVDTYRGTREGALRLAGLLEKVGVKASFLFSLGPDHTGRALKRVFRRGFLGKVKRTSVLEHYGLKTLMYGVLLPGPQIGKRCAGEMRGIAAGGFEVGVHTWDHVRWQDGVATASEPWTRRELTRARDQFAEVFGHFPLLHGAAGWQMNAYVPQLQQELGFRLASDTRGSTPFLPQLAHGLGRVPQLPTTLPTLDELIGRPDLHGAGPVEHLLALTAAATGHDQVFTLHAELEGQKLAPVFEQLLAGWRAQGHTFATMGDYHATLDRDTLPSYPVTWGEIPGRSGELIVQPD